MDRASQAPPRTVRLGDYQIVVFTHTEHEDFPGTLVRNRAAVQAMNTTHSVYVDSELGQPTDHSATCTVDPHDLTISADLYGPATCLLVNYSMHTCYPRSLVTQAAIVTRDIASTSFDNPTTVRRIASR